MPMKERLFAAVLTATLTVGFSLAAQATGVSRDGAIAQLETRADGLKRELLRPPKKGVAVISKLRAHVRDVEQEIARLESGASVDADRVAALLGKESGDYSPAELARRAAAKREANERRLSTGPKLGSLGRQAVREDIERLDSVIAALESGRDVDPDLLGEAVGMMIADAQKTPEQRLQDRRVELAAMERKLGPGPKRGVVTRDKIRDEIEALEAMIERLEDQVGR